METLGSFPLSPILAQRLSENIAGLTALFLMLKSGKRFSIFSVDLPWKCQMGAHHVCGYLHG